MIQEIKNKNLKWWIGVISCLSLFVFIAIFSCEKMSFVWHGVKIESTIEKKEDSNLIAVKGKAAKAIYLSLNGREIFIDKEGNFSEFISPLAGYSVISLSAKDKFGKTAYKKFEIYTPEKVVEATTLTDVVELPQPADKATSEQIN